MTYDSAWYPFRFTFSWLDKIVLKGLRHKLSEEDLKLPHLDRAKETSAIFLKHWDKELKTKRPSLLAALARCYIWDFLLVGLYKLFWGALLLLASFYFVRELIAFIGDPTKSTEIGWYLAVAYFVNCILLGVLAQQMSSQSLQVGIRVRASLLAAIMRKVTYLDATELAVGDVINLCANDCSRLMDATLYFHQLWSGAVEAIAILALLVYLTGPSAFAGVGIVIVLLIIEVVIGYIVARLRSKNIDTTDARVSTMNEILLAIKLVKLYAWEKFFASHVAKIRRKEVKLMSLNAFWKTINLMLVFIVPPVIALVVFSIYVSINGVLTPSIAFTTLSLFNTLRFPLVVLPKALRGFAESVAAIGRVKKFLLKKEMNKVEKDPTIKGVHMSKACFQYTSSEVLLHDINLDITHGQLCAIVGLVSSGKTVLLTAIMGQMQLTSGSYRVGGKIAYVPQTSWVQQGTIRDNILFGLPYDEEKYKRVIYACALNRDFEIMPDGDQTAVGDRGINLSGGQRQRIALARAVYSDADFYILDSPLSAVDQETSVHIFSNCIKGILLGKTVVLVTHHLELIKHCDVVCVMDNGRQKYSGPYSPDAIHAISELFTSWAASKGEEQMVDHKEEDLIVEPDTEIISPDRSRSSSIVENLPHDKTKLDLRAGQSKSPAALSEIAIVVAQQQQQEEEEGDDQEAKSTTMKTERQPTAAVVPAIEAPKEPEQKKRMPAKKSRLEGAKSKIKGYWVWIRACGVVLTLISVSIFGVTQTVRIVSDYWIRWWVADKFTKPKDFYIAIYGVFVFGFFVFLLLRGFVFYSVSIAGATKLHNRMFKRVLQAPVMFFTTTPIGRILNCFSKDQDCIDEVMADTIHMTLIYLAILLTSIILVCVIMPAYAIAGVTLFVVMGIAFVVYSPAAGYLKEKSGETNSAIFAHLSEALQGIAVVRAFEAENRFRRENLKKIDANHNIIFHMEQLQLWLSCRMDFMASVLVFIVCVIAVTSRNAIDSASFGLAISNSFQILVFFAWTVRGLSDINSQISCVDRINYYIENTQQESLRTQEKRRKHRLRRNKNNQQGTSVDCGQEVELEENWPSRGLVEIKDLVLRYLPDQEPVLKGVSLVIQAGEKVGVVGRTGSGKTTLLMSLFRLIEPVSGTVIIDGVDIRKLDLEALRRRIAIIPQEPVMFKGTIRTNLDPFGTHSDMELWEAMECAHLKEQVQRMPEKLETHVAENGANFSLGQKQLFCLARAMLNKSKVLVLDEATAAMDLETDSLIQKTIRTHFADRTIITIAHRLDTIIDSDRILVMDSGRVMEFDSPAKLLSNPDGHFTMLVNQTGTASATALIARANATYQ